MEYFTFILYCFEHILKQYHFLTHLKLYPEPIKLDSESIKKCATLFM